MTTAHGHNGVTTVGPQKPQRWVLLLALVAITAIGITAVALILNGADTEVSTAPAVVAPIEVAPAPAPAEVAVTPAVVAPVLEAPLSLQELALMSEAATGLVPTGVLGQEMALGIEKAYEGTSLSVQELALMNEVASGLVPMGVLEDEMAVTSGFDYSATLGNTSMSGIVNALIEGEALGMAISAEEYALISETLSGLAPVGVLEDEGVAP